MDVEVTRSGGFAGITRFGSTPEDELPADLQQPLRSLLAAPPAASGGADRFVYTVKRGDQEVTVDEQALDADARRLLQWVLSRRS